MADTDVTQKLEELTYERQDISYFGLVGKTLERNCPLAQPSSIAGSNTASLQALGQLDLLPLEILQNILQLLDLHTLTLMQSINHRSKLLVDSLPQHREVITHAPNALRAIIGTGLAPHFTIGHLSRALRAQDCSECGSFGAFLHLLDCRRFCWLCVVTAVDILPITQEVARTIFELTDNILRELPCIQRAIPGQYSPDCFHDYTDTRRVALVGLKAAREAYIDLHGSQDAPEEKIFARSKREFVAGRRQNLYLNVWRRTVGPGILCMASIRFPTLNPSNGTLEWGLSCKGCRDGPPIHDEPKDWDTVYTKQGYLMHHEQCKWAKGLLASLMTDSLPKLDTR